MRWKMAEDEGEEESEDEEVDEEEGRVRFGRHAGGSRKTPSSKMKGDQNESPEGQKISGSTNKGSFTPVAAGVGNKTAKNAKWKALRKGAAARREGGKVSSKLKVGLGGETERL